MGARRRCSDLRATRGQPPHLSPGNLSSRIPSCGMRDLLASASFYEQTRPECHRATSARRSPLWSRADPSRALGMTNSFYTGIESGQGGASDIPPPVARSGRQTGKSVNRRCVRGWGVAGCMGRPFRARDAGGWRTQGGVRLAAHLPWAGMAWPFRPLFGTLQP